ncbi:MAG: exopolyphosphatase [Candidatus Arsenophonus melophagi]|nr:exopolyphosphatase [Candidatus Arsenophonus melophagi]
MTLTNPSPSKQVEIAAIDLGSNSFHMIVARIINGALQILTRIKKRVYLCDGLDENNKLSEVSIQRALSCLSLFAERLQGFSADNVCIVGTHALREAINAKEFLQRVEAIIPYPIEIISGQEEARLIFMGVEHTQPEKGKKLVIDVGGGSTELIIGKDFQPLLMASRRMGCISYGSKFFAKNIINETNFSRAYLASQQKLENIACRYKLQGWDCAFGASGTIKTIREVLFQLGEVDGIITPERLMKLKKLVLKYKNFKYINLPGLSVDRIHVFVPGLAILCGIFDSLQIKELSLSEGTLREGVLYEIAGRFRHQNISHRTAFSLADYYNIDREQTNRVSNTLEILYQQWAKQNPKLTNHQLKVLLVWAAMLYEIGLNINHNGLHRHSSYILYNINLPGFNQEQQLLLATLVRYHKKSIKFCDIPKLNLFKKKQFIPMIKLLRLATLLNNQRQSTTTLTSLRLHADHSHWTLYFPAYYFQQNALMFLDLKKEQKYWKEIPGWKLNIKEESS